ncbi:MAG: tyrosine--tRNA ligase [Jiangellaceae bacterium]
MAEILDELRWRGLVALSTDDVALDAALAAGPVTYYCGFDPTAPSLHHGHLVQLLTARRLQLAGHRPLALVGGSTGLIGDPNPDRERMLNDPEVVAGWVELIKRQVEPFFDFDGPNAARVVNNLDWTAPLSAIEFLRDVGQHFRVNKMLAKEAVRARLDSEIGIGYPEFSYQILQALDYLELHRRHGCTLQTGGSDQWGNLTAGVDLIRRVEGQAVHAFATPLLAKADGTKYGKTAGGAVWLDPGLLAPYGFYQFWLNLDDADVPSHLRIMSFRSREEIEALEKQTADHPAARAGQRALAEELTTLVHGAEETAKVVAASRALFGQGSLEDLDERTLGAALAETSFVRVEAGAELPSYVDLFVATGLVRSRSAARRAIAEGGAYVNNTRVEPSTEPETPLPESELLHGRWIIMRRGKRTVGAAEVVR